MLIRQHDAAKDDDEWRTFLAAHPFGQFIASGRDREIPVIVPTHFAFDGASTILFHLAKPNPVWEALAENSSAVMSVASAYAYIPTTVNGGTAEPPGYGVPTSYYGAVQATGECEVVDEQNALAEILRAQLAVMQPEGGYEPVEPGDNPFGRQMSGIRGIRLAIENVRAKFKFGNNKTVEHRINIAEYLAAQPGDQEAEAREQLLRRMAT